MPVRHFQLTIDEFRDSGFYPSRTRTFRRDEATERRAHKRPLIRAEESRRVSGSGITAPWRTSRESRDDRGRRRGDSQQQTSSVYRGNLHHEYAAAIPANSALMMTTRLRPAAGSFAMDVFFKRPVFATTALPGIMPQEYGLSCRFLLGGACCE